MRAHNSLMRAQWPFEYDLKLNSKSKFFIFKNLFIPILNWPRPDVTLDDRLGRTVDDIPHLITRHSHGHLSYTTPRLVRTRDVLPYTLYTIARFPVPVSTGLHTENVHIDGGLGWTPYVLRRTPQTRARRSSTNLVHCSLTVHPLFTRVTFPRYLSY